MPNIVVITADDLSLHTLGAAGNKIGVTPNLDRFAQSGFFFKNAHCNIPFCMPSRSVLMSGLYPQNNGSLAFNPMYKHVETLPSVLRRHGYYTGIIGKVGHHKPDSVFNWHYADQPWGGRDVKLLCQSIKTFLQSARQPYFLLINSHNPHRPFLRDCKLNEADIEIPSFLPDNAAMRDQFYQYYCTVKKLDHSFQEMMNLLNPALAVFTSDHGMSFPFVKGNCYHYSTNVPLIIAGKGIQPRTDDHHLVSHVDLLPTIMNCVGLNHTCEGTSYAKLLLEGSQDGLDYVYSQLNGMFSGPAIQTRAITSRYNCYVVNVDGNYPAGSVDGWGWHDSVRALPPEYLQKLLLRPGEEFITVKEGGETKEELRLVLLEKMKQFRDPLLKQVRVKTMKL